MLLPITIFLSYFGSLPFGMINLNVMYTELKRGRKAALLMACGASLIEWVQGIVAAIVFSRLVEFWQYEEYFRYATIIVFLSIAGYYFFKPKIAIDPLAQNEVDDKGHPLLKGLLISSFNFMAIPFWLIILSFITEVLTIEWATTTWVVFGFGAGLGGFLASFTYMAVGKKYLSKSKLILKYLDFSMGILFILLAALTFVL